METGKIITAITAAYPGYFRNSTVTDITNLVNTWNMVMADYTYEQVSAGLKIFLTSDTKGFPPSPGQVIDCILKITHPDSQNMTEGEAWSMVRNAIERGIYHAEEDYEKFPEIVKKAVGSPSNIRSMASDEEFNEGVAKSLFERTYRQLKERERKDAKIPNDVKKLIQSTINQIEQKGETA